MLKKIAGVVIILVGTIGVASIGFYLLFKYTKPFTDRSFMFGMLFLFIYMITTAVSLGIGCSLIHSDEDENYFRRLENRCLSRTRKTCGVLSVLIGITFIIVIVFFMTTPDGSKIFTFLLTTLLFSFIPILFGYELLTRRHAETQNLFNDYYSDVMDF